MTPPFGASPVPSRVFASAALALCLCAGARADVRLPALFTDHAVLQRDRPLPVWGWADPGEKVGVKLGTEAADATAGKDGRWQITLKPQPVSKTPLVLTVAGKNTVAVKDVLLGDVWLCAGESNMEWPMLGAYNGLPALAASRNPRLRLFQVGKMIAPVPRYELQGRWQPATAETLGDFSAVAYFFGEVPGLDRAERVGR